MFSKTEFEIHSQSEFGVPKIKETHSSFIENALAKARHASYLTGLPSIADDSGICINALNGSPGILSARYAGEPVSDKRNNCKLLTNLAPYTDRSAYYYCVLVFLRYPNDPQPVVSDYQWNGFIIDQARGAGGFGYDPYFFIPEKNKTVAELSILEKNTISHRGRALHLLLEKLQ